MNQIRGVLLVVGVVGLFAVFGLSWASKRIEAAASEIRPLETQKFDEFSVFLLGTGTGAPNQRRYGPATGVGFRHDFILVDAGRGVADALRSAGIPAEQVKHVFLTSLLPEATVGLDDLTAARARVPGAADLSVFGPVGVDDFVLGLAASNHRSLDNQREIEGLRAVPDVVAGPLVGTDGLASVGDLQVDWLRVGEEPFPTMSYRISRGETSVAIASRVFDLEALARATEDATFWVQAATYRASVEAAIEAGASDPERLRAVSEKALAVEELGALAKQMNVAHVILTQLSPPPVFGFQYTRILGKDFQGAVSVASDGDVFTR